MPAKGSNSKKEAGRAKKAENEEKKKQSAVMAKEQKEEDKWSQGSKSNKAKEEKEEKRKAELARKQELARLLAEEEASLPAKPKPAPKASGKKAAASSKTPAGPGAIAAGGLVAPSTIEKATQNDVDQLQESFSATGIDDAIDLMEIVTAKTDKASTGAAAAGLERHPERRFKAALETYTEHELPKLKEEHPGLRLNQYKELLYKQFQKSPDNPFNQTTVDYNASKEEKVSALKSRRDAIEGRLRTGD